MRGLKDKKVAAELLAKLLGDEIKVRSKRNLVQSREFSAVTAAQQRPGVPVTRNGFEETAGLSIAEQWPGFPMLKKTLNAYHNRVIAAQEVIEELIKLAKQMSAATQRGVDLGLNDNEVAFYDRDQLHFHRIPARTLEMSNISNAFVVPPPSTM